MSEEKYQMVLVTELDESYNISVIGNSKPDAMRKVWQQINNHGYILVEEGSKAIQGRYIYSVVFQAE